MTTELETLAETSTLAEAPSLTEIDDAIAEYEHAKLLADGAAAKASIARDRVIQLVDSFGHTPSHAEQSTRLTGRRNVATVTRGTTVVVNEAGVAALNSFLFTNRLESLIPRFFAAHTKHTLVEGARDVLKTLQLARRMEESIAALFGKAFDVKAKSPSLKVETIKPEKPARSPRDKKTAA